MLAVTDLEAQSNTQAKWGQEGARITLLRHSWQVWRENQVCAVNVKCFSYSNKPEIPFDVSVLSSKIYTYLYIYVCLCIYHLSIYLSIYLPSISIYLSIIIIIYLSRDLGICCKNSAHMIAEAEESPVCSRQAGDSGPPIRIAAWMPAGSRNGKTDVLVKIRRQGKPMPRDI